MRGAVLLLLLALPPRALAQDAEAEQAAVQARLAAQRTGLALLESERATVLETLELTERLARLSSTRVKAAEREVRALERRLTLTTTLEQLAAGAVREQLLALGPRLRLMDRRLRRRPLDLFLSAESFSSLVWRARAMSTLLAQDVAALKQVERSRAFQAQAAAELAGLKGLVAERLEALKAHRKREAEQQAALTDLLRLVQAEGRESRRLVKELERSERELSAYVAELKAGPDSTGFGALKGRLRMPAQGRIEVGFGKVVDPRFNTVTVQKGVDIRAPAGSPVRAVADGRVVHAGWMRGYGNLLILDHGDGYHTLMAHLDTLDRDVGEDVRGGQVVGTVGDTASLKGAYLYFELRRSGEALDPAVWVKLD
jgi:septal ring factor EnvC (AmiA/AmiB activator)